MLNCSQADINATRNELEPMELLMGLAEETQDSKAQSRSLLFVIRD